MYQGAQKGGPPDRGRITPIKFFFIYNMTYCTEHTLLPEQSVSPPRKRKRRTAAASRKRLKLEWPKIPEKHVRVFLLPEHATKPSILDFLKSEHLEGLRETCQNEDIDKVLVGPVLNKKGEPTGRELVVYYAEDGLHGNKKPNAYLNTHLSSLGTLDLLGNVVLGAQSAKTGNIVSVKASDIAHLASAAQLGAEQQEALKEAAIEAGGIKSES